MTLKDQVQQLFEKDLSEIIIPLFGQGITPGELWGALTKTNWFVDPDIKVTYTSGSASVLIDKLLGASEPDSTSWYIPNRAGTVPKLIAERLATRGWNYEHYLEKEN